MQGCKKLTKIHTKTLVFTTLDMLQLNNWWLWEYS